MDLLIEKFLFHINSAGYVTMKKIYKSDDVHVPKQLIFHVFLCYMSHVSCFLIEDVKKK